MGATESGADRDLSVLESKRNATRYLILVEVAKRQPAVSQKEIADSVGLTAQAVSDYLRDLVDQGYVEKHGRGRYEVTKEGVDWLMSQTDSLRDLTDYVTDEVVEEVEVDTAIAAGDVEEGGRVSVAMRDGFLRAIPSDAGTSMTAVAVTDAEEGEAVGITDFDGVLDYDQGTVRVVSVPNVDDEGRVGEDFVGEADDALVASSGPEAYTALRRAGVEPDIRFGTEAAVEEAAMKGVDVLLVVVEDELPQHIDRLREANVSYELTNAD